MPMGEGATGSAGGRLAKDLDVSATEWTTADDPDSDLAADTG